MKKKQRSHKFGKNNSMVIGTIAILGIAIIIWGAATKWKFSGSTDDNRTSSPPPPPPPPSPSPSPPDSKAKAAGTKNNPPPSSGGEGASDEATVNNLRALNLVESVPDENYEGFDAGLCPKNRLVLPDIIRLSPPEQRKKEGFYSAGWETLEAHQFIKIFKNISPKQKHLANLKKVAKKMPNSRICVKMYLYNPWEIWGSDKLKIKGAACDPGKEGVAGTQCKKLHRKLKKGVFLWNSAAYMPNGLYLEKPSVEANFDTDAEAEAYKLLTKCWHDDSCGKYSGGGGPAPGPSPPPTASSPPPSRLPACTGEGYAVEDGQPCTTCNCNAVPRCFVPTGENKMKYCKYGSDVGNRCAGPTEKCLPKPSTPSPTPSAPRTCKKNGDCPRHLSCFPSQSTQQLSPKAQCRGSGLCCGMSNSGPNTPCREIRKNCEGYESYESEDELDGSYETYESYDGGDWQLTDVDEGYDSDAMDESYDPYQDAYESSESLNEPFTSTGDGMIHRPVGDFGSMVDYDPAKYMTVTPGYWRSQGTYMIDF